MRLSLLSAVVLVGLSLSGIAVVAGDPAAKVVPAPKAVSLVQLISTPATFDGQLVRVVGLCHLEFEGNGLYLHKEDFDHHINKNAIWLDLGPEKQEFSDKYVLVEGRFDARDQGHNGSFSGRLRDVSRVSHWVN